MAAVLTEGRIQLPDVHVHEVSGIPAYWAPIEGPITATLYFDGGICLEPPHLRGVQHLLEHLVLERVGPRVHEYNGFVDLRRLAFTVRGDPGEVQSFFDLVSVGLIEVPTERHQLEPGVLGAEALRSQSSTMTNLLTYLFGSAGPGVAALPELAVMAVEPPDLQSWATEHVHSGRAALVCSADPSFLDLGDVPRGTPGPPWKLPAQIDGPGWIGGNASGFAAVAVIPRDTATATMTRVLRDHVLDHVRRREGVSYSVDVTYEPLTAGDVLVGFFVDAAPDRRVKARNVMFEAIDRFVADGPDPKWLELDAGRRARMNREPTAGFGLANYAGAANLLGQPDPLSSAWLEEYQALTPKALADTAGHFFKVASWQMPNEAPMPPWRQIRRLRVFAESKVDGRELVPVRTLEYRMIAGATGLSVVHGPERVITARFADVVVVEKWHDGNRVLHLRDANQVGFHPADWAESPEFLAWLDSKVADKPVLLRHA